eukprot:gnl/Dysnectes_brevis/3149_a3924_756.p2 GENE.gnl/Dysnectes_brevis/3149_a3924_756~~gnl/Dysnectes_brevis/3149_a3924_756.p2  ORF type:complete len:373 (+),score=74.89 gnl/Dysnectes_brevis/3149_a3924_756:1675-2793(+)
MSLYFIFILLIAFTLSSEEFMSKLDTSSGINVLVAGGAGYIGSHIVEALLASSDIGRVVILDNLSTGHREAVSRQPGAKLVIESVQNIPFVTSILQSERIDCVIHTCAFSLVGESMRQPLKYYENNVGGTLALLQAMEHAGVNSLLVSSTAAVYGAPDPSQIPISEDTPTNPTNAYGQTKLAMENMISWQTRAKGLHAISLRYFNAAGASTSGLIGEDHSPESHLIPNMFKACHKGDRPMTLFGTDYPTRDGTCVRDYIDVRDLAQAHLLAVKRLASLPHSTPTDSGSFEVFNLGSGSGYTIREMIEAAGRVTGRDMPVVEGPRRAGDPPVLVAASGLARRKLGWEPEHEDVEDILGSAWAWHSGYPEGYCE